MSCDCNLRKRILKEKIPVNSRDVYLDYNATTKPDISVLAAIEKVNRNLWGNPSAQNSKGVNVYNFLLKKIDQCKKKLSLSDYKVFFDTSSSSLIYRIYKAKYHKTIYTSNIEHPSLLINSDSIIEVDNKGHIRFDKLLKIPVDNRSKPILIYSPVNHETGNIQPYQKIYSICKEKGINIIFDAVQTISRIELKNWISYCDGFYYSGHKIHGIKGAAALFIKNDILDFKTHNTPLPFSLYTGTFNTGSVIGLIEATNLLQESFENYLENLRILHGEAIQIIRNIDNVHIESSDNGAPGIINITLPPLGQIEELLLYLNKNGIQLSRLSACSGNINDESYVLKNMGRDIFRCKNSLRLSFGKYSKRDDFFRVTSSIKKYYNRI